MDLLDLIQEADKAKHEAIDRVEANASPQWLTACYSVITQVAFSRDIFTSDDIWDALDRAKVDAPAEPRALGSVMRQAMRDGLITTTDKYVPSTRAVCHGNPKRCWRRV